MDRSALVQEAAAAREETSRPASVSGMLGAAISISLGHCPSVRPSVAKLRSCPLGLTLFRLCVPTADTVRPYTPFRRLSSRGFSLLARPTCTLPIPPSFPLSSRCSVSACLPSSLSPPVLSTSSFSRRPSVLHPFSVSTLHTLFRRTLGAVTARTFNQPPLQQVSFLGPRTRGDWLVSWLVRPWVRYVGRRSSSCASYSVGDRDRRSPVLVISHRSESARFSQGSGSVVCTGFSISSFDQVRGITETEKTFGVDQLRSSRHPLFPTLLALLLVSSLHRSFLLRLLAFSRDGVARHRLAQR
ncbi:uncharacterized protein LOC143181042 [Calliopsis andreniformis]|uniref:uncharacterized protein LOC143181042 n=1 Tax=Calliopsis andreniformis TaxID=337506 RepID=UPI003FCC44E5